MSGLSIPNYVKAANSTASALSNMVFSSAAVAAGVGAYVGAFYKKPANYAVQVALIDLFWKYAFPYTFEKIFFHTESNDQAKLLGAGLSGLVCASIPYLYKYLVSFIPKETSYVGRLAKEEADTPSNFGEIAKIFAIAAVVFAVPKWMTCAWYIASMKPGSGRMIAIPIR